MNRSNLVLTCIGDLGAWLHEEQPAWARDLVRIVRGHINRAGFLRLLRADGESRSLGFLLYEQARRPFPPHFHFVVTDPEHRRKGVATALKNRMLLDMPERPIHTTPLSEEGRLTLEKWGFTPRGFDWALY